MKCPSCGGENRSGATFCAACGSPLTDNREPFSLLDSDVSAGAREDLPLPDHQDALAGAELAPTGKPTIRLERERPAEREEAAPSAPATPSGPRGGPLVVGDVLAGRFEIVQIVEQSPERNAYRARDWGRCLACGYDDNAREDCYCLECGASLDRPLYASISERFHLPPGSFDLSFSEANRDYYVTLDTAPDVVHTDESGVSEGKRLVLGWGRATDSGLARDRNEDYAECWTFSQASGPRLGFFVVADGLGGTDSGEVASEMATLVAWGVVRAKVWEPILRGEAPEVEAVRGALIASVDQANRAVYDARVKASSEMSTTITMALVLDGHAIIANVGDSRTYLCGARGLEAITRDHSLVQRLVDAGQITRAEVYSHPRRNLIFQSIGDRPEVQPDLFEVELQPDDRLLLCSDGLWEAVRDEGIEEALMAEQDPQRACELLVRHANLAGGEDNITVIIVRAQADPASPRG